MNGLLVARKRNALVRKLCSITDALFASYLDEKRRSITGPPLCVSALALLILALALRVFRIPIVHAGAFLIAFLAWPARILLLLLPRIGLTALLIFALRRVVLLVGHWSRVPLRGERSVLAACVSTISRRRRSGARVCSSSVSAAVPAAWNRSFPAARS